MAEILRSSDPTIIAGVGFVFMMIGFVLFMIDFVRMVVFSDLFRK